MMQQLNELIQHYHVNKLEAESYKKIADKDNAQIKEIMVKEKLTEFVTTDGIKATCSVTHKQKFDEDCLISIIKGLGVEGIIKQKEYVDMDALENAIYNGQVCAADLVSAQESTEVITLRTSTAKK